VLAQPLEVTPRERVVDDVAELRRRLEAGAQVALTAADLWQIDGDDDRAVAGSLGALDEVLHLRAVGAPVQLEPARAVGSSLSCVLEADRRQRGEAHDRPGGGRTSGHGLLAVWMREPLERHRRHEHRKAHLDA
jgi:hypothetical protein